MLGALAKEILPKTQKATAHDLVVISIMPCTAKKFEAERPEFMTDGVRDVDIVLTTQELARMIEESGLRFRELEPASMDQPFGFKTGAGVIFGVSGGVTEAVLRYAAEAMAGVPLGSVEFKAVRGEAGLREATISIADQTLRLAVVHGLEQAKRVAEQVRNGDSRWDLIEVMACPGGCVGGAGQPVAHDPVVRKLRTKGLYDADRVLDFHKAQDNHMVNACYDEHLGEIGGDKAHHLLHTCYMSRKRIAGRGMDLLDAEQDTKVEVNVCLGTSCILRGSQHLLSELGEAIEERGLQDDVELKATFCMERCSRGPNVCIGGTVIEKCTFTEANDLLSAKLAGLKDAPLPASAPSGSPRSADPARACL